MATTGIAEQDCSILAARTNLETTRDAEALPHPPQGDPTNQRKTFGRIPHNGRSQYP